MTAACDVLVIGSTAAAHAAAREVARAGGEVSLLAAEAPRLPGVTPLRGTPWAAEPPLTVAAIVEGGPVLLRPRAVILAEAPTSLPVPVPGWALPRVATLDQPRPPGRLIYAGTPDVLAAAVAARDVELVVLLPGHALRPAHRVLRATLVAAGTRVIEDTRLVSIGQAAGALSVRAGKTLVAEADGCVLHAGWAAETALARQLGAAHQPVAPGLLATVTDAHGRTSCPGLYVVTSVAEARRAALLATGRTPGPVARLRHAAPPPAASAAAFADGDVVCACEAVTAWHLRAALAQGAESVPALKRATRATMGACQGRRCAPVIHAFAPGLPDGGAGHGTARAPLRPTRIAALMAPLDVPARPFTAPPARPLGPAAPPPATCDVLVVGGGAVGLCAALALARAGRGVLLIDRGHPGLGASTANAGSLHVQLLPPEFSDADPGPLAEALALGPASIALWRDLAQQANESFGIRTEGGLILAATPRDLVALSRKAAFERSRGIDTRIIDAAALAQLAPTLAPAAGAAFCAMEGQIDPLRATAALLRLARDAGVRIAANVCVSALDRDGVRWRAVTDAGPIRANQVLNACGAHALALAALAGVVLPVRAIVQQVIATAPSPPLLRHLVAQAGRRLSLKQTEAGHLLIGGGWPGQLEACGGTRVDLRSVQGSLHIAAAALPALAGLDIVRAWTGLTVHLDRGPVISATPGLPGLFHAVTSNGYTLAPIAAQLVTEAMLGRDAPPRDFAL